MAKVLPLVRKHVLLEEDKVRRLMKTLNVNDESEAIRAAIDDRLFADEVMWHVRQLRRRGTVPRPTVNFLQMNSSAETWKNSANFFACALPPRHKRSRLLP